MAFFTCSNCSHLIMVSNDMMGQLTDCPKCKQIVEVPFQKSAYCPSKPKSGIAVDNGFIWVVAFVPVWGYIVQLIVAEMTSWNIDTLWFIPLGLNIIFCSIDNGILKNAGHNTETFGIWAWLIPVYLYKRAKALTQSLSYFIAWMAFFVVSLFLPMATSLSDARGAPDKSLSASHDTFELRRQVETSIRATWDKDPELASAYILKFALLHRGGNQYDGLLEASVGGRNVKLAVDVTYDGSSFIWAINKR